MIQKLIDIWIFLGKEGLSVLASLRVLGMPNRDLSEVFLIFQIPMKILSGQGWCWQEGAHTENKVESYCETFSYN